METELIPPDSVTDICLGNNKGKKGEVRLASIFLKPQDRKTILSKHTPSKPNSKSEKQTMTKSSGTEAKPLAADASLSSKMNNGSTIPSSSSTNKVIPLMFTSLSQGNQNQIAKQSTKQKSHKQSIAFTLVGKVDGVSYQMDLSSDDHNAWKPLKVIVEIKNRVRRLHSPPPLYEQIQLVTYMLMTGATYGDLVQVLATGDRRNVVEGRSPKGRRATSDILVDAEEGDKKRLKADDEMASNSTSSNSNGEAARSSESMPQQSDLVRSKTAQARLDSQQDNHAEPELR
jgi:hypothetical protein